jgi:voltage-gated sodium channel
MMNEMLRIHKDIENEEERQLENERCLAKKFEDRLQETLEKVCTEIQEGRQHMEKDVADQLAHLQDNISLVQKECHSLTDNVCKMEVQLEHVSADEQALHGDNATTAVELRRMKEAMDTHMKSLFPFIEDHIVKSQVDTTPILDEINRIGNAVNGDMGTLEEVLGEIGKVQKALFVDHIQKKIKPDRSDKRTASRIPTVGAVGGESTGSPAEASGPSGEYGDLAVQEGVRVREFFTQTATVETQESEAQTDKVEDDDMKHRKSTPKPKPRSSIVKPETEMAKKKKPKNVIDGDAMKQQMREALIKGEYNVCDYYWETGCAQRIARSSKFEHMTFLVIFLNGIWIAVDADHNEEAMLIDAHPVFQVVENCFCTYFTIELLIRFVAFKDKRNCRKDFWFSFDSVLVTLFILETWIITAIVASTQSGGGDSEFADLSMLRMFRMVKLFRMARMARILRSIPELVVLIKTIGVAARSVFFFFIFWLIIIFMFGVGFRQATKGSDIGDQYFETVPTAMNTLLLDGLLPAQASFVNELAGANALLWPFIIIFILLASLTIMNMLIGVLVEVVNVVAVTEKEKMAVLGVKHDLEDAMEYLGVDTHQPLPLEQFVKLLMNNEMLKVIQNVGVDPLALVDAAEYIYADLDRDAESRGLKSSPGLSFEMLIDILLKMRGKNPATVKDIKEHTRYMKTMIVKVEELINRLHKKMSKDLHTVLHHVEGYETAEWTTAVTEYRDDDDDPLSDDRSFRGSRRGSDESGESIPQIFKNGGNLPPFVGQQDSPEESDPHDA